MSPYRKQFCLAFYSVWNIILLGLSLVTVGQTSFNMSVRRQTPQVRRHVTRREETYGPHKADHSLKKVTSVILDRRMYFRHLQTYMLVYLACLNEIPITSIERYCGVKKPLIEIKPVTNK